MRSPLFTFGVCESIYFECRDCQRKSSVMIMPPFVSPSQCPLLFYAKEDGRVCICGTVKRFKFTIARTLSWTCFPYIFEGGISKLFSRKKVPARTYEKIPACSKANTGFPPFVRSLFLEKKTIFPMRKVSNLLEDEALEIGPKLLRPHQHSTSSQRPRKFFTSLKLRRVLDEKFIMT